MVEFITSYIILFAVCAVLTGRGWGMGRLTGWLDGLKWLSPLRWLNPFDSSGAGKTAVQLSICVIVISGAAALGVLGYRIRRFR